MKNIIHFSILLLLLTFMTISENRIQCQPEPPPPPEQHGYNGNSSTTGAPVGNGTELVILLGLFYAGKNYIQIKRKAISQEEK